ncbi:hypothetical protein [Methylobacterium sp. NEAU K]|uniref:hypothetical protein n=1 Tax=Methylobacterium sp. NEAU K TaxID=3064946 RepID=UPI002734FA3B|nr:hypothetical protein [Methylobacterium sp. NEAU K]MDP4006424.1 hypothetical protein [Methylobacterium sp. NEAU K]
MTLTGRFWFRRTWTGKLILLVEEERPRWFRRRGSTKLRWRDAKLLDLAETPLRALMTLERSYRAEFGTGEARRVPGPAPVAAIGGPAVTPRGKAPPS